MRAARATGTVGRRRYALEKAYGDYGARIGWAWRGFTDMAGGIWYFFVHDERSRTTVALLSTLLQMGALVLLAAFGHGHAVIYAIGLVVILASLLVFSNGEELGGLFVRLVCGVTAATVVLIIAGVVLLPVVAVFIVYLLILLALTVLSILLFVPMRLWDEATLLWRRIARRCPYDDCGRAGLPLHVCSCGAVYDDLRPNFYGVFHHACEHGKGTVRLPTLDILGRKRLPRLCRHCKRPIALSSFGELPERPIAIVGGAGAGKTVFLRQATRLLRDQLGQAPGSAIEVDGEDQRKDLEADLRLLDEGRVLAKTAGDVMQAFALAVRLRRPHSLRCLLYLFDAPGEHFTTMERFGRKQAVQHLAGIVLLVDPLSLPGLAKAGAGTASLSTVAGTLLAGAAGMLMVGPGGTTAVPLAVVLSKSDALPAEMRKALGPADAADASARCRRILERLGAGNELRALEQRFSDIRYFACSALGRPPTPHQAKPFKPVGVLRPLLWLLRLDRP